MGKQSTRGRETLVQPHIILYSHGFGVKKDSRGMFTDIATALPEFQHEMFDYNQHDEPTNQTFITPLSKQAKILENKIQELRKQYPTATIDIVAHSQGCIVAGMVASPEIRHTVLLAPPTDNVGDRKKSFLLNRPGVTTDENDVIYLPRRDGSISVITPTYWDDWEDLDPIEIYNRLPTASAATLVTATQDEVLPAIDYTHLSPKITRVDVVADHNFTGEGRAKLCDSIKAIVASQLQ
ncbi:MAG TPA: hypothetical protein VGE34_04370 [Candidatus Saccharimonadales bacterium]